MAIRIEDDGSLHLDCEPLTPAAFAPFGDVICAGIGVGKDANQGSAVRFDWAAQLSSTRADARPNLAVFRSMARELPFRLRLLEHHPCSSQAFVPMRCDRYLICVAPTAADGLPDLAGLRAFVCVAGQGVNYHCGVWHHPIVALGGDGEFVMLAWEDGAELDCVESHFVVPVDVGIGSCASMTAVRASFDGEPSNPA